MKRSSGVKHLKSRVLAVLGTIPEGRVTTYGTIAKHLQVTSRQVAFVLASFTIAESRTLPWFRVVAANGVVSSTKRGMVGRRQVARLRVEGVAITPRNKIEDFQEIVWFPVERSATENWECSPETKLRGPKRKSGR